MLFHFCEAALHVVVVLRRVGSVPGGRLVVHAACMEKVHLSCTHSLDEFLRLQTFHYKLNKCERYTTQS